MSSILAKDFEKYDYTDSYSGIFSDPENQINIETIVRDFSKPLPGWIEMLMSLRDRIVSLVGLKTSEKERQAPRPDHYTFNKVDKVGFFNVYSYSTREVILGEDDKHLNLRVSLLLENVDSDSIRKRVTISTVVIYNNWMGRFYFFFVKPFHCLIVPAMMKKDHQY